MSPNAKKDDVWLDHSLRCLGVGMDDYISKSIQLEELRSKLNKWKPHEERSMGISAFDRNV